MTEDTLGHARLQELVASFADGELSPDASRAVEEHLAGCARCRRELAIQQDLSSALAREPTEQASAALRQRIEWMGEPRTEGSRRASPFQQRWLSPALAAVVLVGVASAMAWIARRDQANRQVAEAPLLRDALADCRRAMARNFPKKADLPGVSDGLRFQVQPLRRPGVDLFSTWKTTLAGAPAAGLAYRWRGIVVVQYSVPAELIRQQPGFAARGSGAAFYEGSHLGQGVIALLQGGSGTLLIAEVPPAELRRLIL